LSPLLTAGGSAETRELGEALGTGIGAAVLDGNGNGKDDDGGADKDVATDDAAGALGACGERVGTPGSPGRLSPGTLSVGMLNDGIGKMSPDVGVPPPKISEKILSPNPRAMGTKAVID